jgi:hypothetical protein
MSNVQVRGWFFIVPTLQRGDARHGRCSVSSEALQWEGLDQVVTPEREYGAFPRRSVGTISD